MARPGYAEVIALSRLEIEGLELSGLLRSAAAARATKRMVRFREPSLRSAAERP
jgi:hypothetical protein